MSKLIATVGLPASGKTTYATSTGLPVVTKDDIRAELTKTGWVWSREAEADVVFLRDAEITKHLMAGEDVISADTNLGKDHLPHLKDLARRYKAIFEIKDFRDVPPWVCAERNAARGYTVPEKVIWEMAEQHLTPTQLVPGRRSPQLFVDLDGVIADFDGFIQKEFNIVNDRTKEDPPHFWDTLRGYRGRLYFDMEPLPGALDTFGALRVYEPTILTGVPFSIPSAAQDKREWVSKYLGPNVKVVTCKSRNKWKYCSPGDVLLDDWEKYRPEWEGVGGRWVTYKDPETSIREVKSLLG